MTCKTNTATAAKCEPCCDGDLSKDRIGCVSGWMASPRQEEKKPQTASLLMPRTNGEMETVEKQEIGETETRCGLLRQKRRQSRTLLYALIVSCISLGVCIGAAVTAVLLT